MAKETKQPEPEVVEQPAPPAAGRSSRLYILIGLVSLVLLQTTILFFMLPTRGMTQKELDALAAQEKMRADVGYIPNSLPKDDVKKADLAEKTLGDKFRVEEPSRTNREETDVFTAAFIVLINKSDEKIFDKLWLEKTGTIRAEVLATLRASTIEDRSSETLSNIRRAIKKKINDVLGTPYVQDVQCTEIQTGKL